MVGIQQHSVLHSGARRSSRDTQMKRGAFTLVEILVVLAIIAALCALVFGVMGHAREDGRQRVCGSNLHQFGLAFGMYIQDYDGVDPQVGVAISGEAAGLPPPSYTFDFFKQYKIDTPAMLMCPSAHWSNGVNHSTYSSYTWVGFAAGDSTFPQLAQKYGPELPLVLCDMHNADTDFTHKPSWETVWVQ